MGKQARFGPGLRGRDCVSEGRVVLHAIWDDHSRFMEDNLEKYWIYTILGPY